ncbi:MAG: eukaryotic translation initiation factor 1A, X-chromosomal [Faunusvirus sp.]|jgi:initiation factor 1A|uniref:Eukaryotic translation initiation factor 1A, X-chromosomal n=1 Tax=Faunusvirus sp. TaxID=2487766 RepID=A0A3G4ZWV4_9VIRU|nr:MAG: eukaryotic translation initiation factor 1A, X-chromosomal [Faunusvirus sp.]
MSAQNKGGNKQKKKANKSKHEAAFVRPIPKRDDSQVYGKIIKILGGANVRVECQDNIDTKVERICIMRGHIKKTTRFNVGDVILVSLRAFQDKTGDIIEKFNPDEIKILRKTNIEKDIIEKLLYGDQHDVVEFGTGEKEDEFDFESI